MKKDVKRWICWAFMVLFLIGMGLLGLSGFGSIHAKACDFELDEGISCGSDGLYYMPAELISEGDWSAFRGSNGMVYEYDYDVFGCDLEDAPYLLTMDSRGTKEWYDDTILVIWKDAS